MMQSSVHGLALMTAVGFMPTLLNALNRPEKERARAAQVCVVCHDQIHFRNVMGDRQKNLPGAIPRIPRRFSVYVVLVNF